MFIVEHFLHFLWKMMWMMKCPMEPPSLRFLLRGSKLGWAVEIKRYARRWPCYTFLRLEKRPITQSSVWKCSHANDIIDKGPMMLVSYAFNRWISKMIKHMFKRRCDSHGGSYMWTLYVKTTTPVLNIWLCNNISHIQDYIIFVSKPHP